jgi:hypothetical protein
MLSNRISFFYDLRGPSMTIDTGCSASMVALSQACQTIWAGESDLSIVTGANAMLNEDMFIAMSCLGYVELPSPCSTNIDKLLGLSAKMEDALLGTHEPTATAAVRALGSLYSNLSTLPWRPQIACTLSSERVARTMTEKQPPSRPRPWKRKSSLSRPHTDGQTSTLARLVMLKHMQVPFHCDLFFTCKPRGTHP